MVWLTHTLDPTTLHPTTLHPMTNRQSQLLKNLIEKYLVSAEPVASALLAEKSDVSSATIRNDMAVLEDDGFIEQPHTSAGRVPTIKGYKFYIANYIKPVKISAAQQKNLKNAVRSSTPIKSVAKELAELTDQAILVALANNDFYYTGISKLFAQPEFSHHQEVISISSVLDALDKVLVELFETADDETKIIIGDDNPFSPHCSLLVTESKVSQSAKGLLVILGPLRMNYNKNLGLLNYSQNILNKL